MAFTPISLVKTLEDTGSHIYIILGNLQSRADNVKLLLSDLGLSEAVIHQHVTIVKGITKKDMENVTQRMEIVQRSKGLISAEYIEKALFYSGNQMACFMSQILVWQMFEASAHKNAIIFEDDAHFSDTDELQLLHRYNSSSTFPSKQSKEFVGVSQIEKQLVLMNKMLRMNESMWDIQYLGFCFDCTNVKRHAIHVAKTFYLENGIDAFLPTLAPLAGANANPNANADSVALNQRDREKKPLNEEEVNDLARYFFQYGGTNPLCLHAYVVNHKMSARMLNYPGGLDYRYQGHWSADGFAIDIACRYGLHKVRSIIPIFKQYCKGDSTGYLKHNYAKPAEKGTCEGNARHCHKLFLNQQAGQGK